MIKASRATRSTGAEVADTAFTGDFFGEAGEALGGFDDFVNGESEGLADDLVDGDLAGFVAAGRLGFAVFSGSTCGFTLRVAGEVWTARFLPGFASTLVSAVSIGSGLAGVSLGAGSVAAEGAEGSSRSAEETEENNSSRKLR